MLKKSLLAILVFSCAFSAWSNPRRGWKQVVKVVGVEEKVGQLCYLVFTDSGDFNDPSSAVIDNCKRIRKKKDIQKIRIGVPEGKYAIVVYHDKNSDTILNRDPATNLPTEKIGFSKNPLLKGKAPSVSECLVRFNQERRPIKVKLTSAK